MLSILDRYFLRELAQTVAAVAIVLLVIMAGSAFARVLQQVANGSFPASVMFQVLGLNMLDGLSNLLPLAGFLGVFWALGRMYRESEMHVLASSGMGPMGLLRPVGILALGLALLSGIVSMWLGPWAARTSDALVANANRSVIAAGLDAGRFTQLPGKGGIIFVDSLSRDGSVLGNTLMVTERPGKDNGPAVLKVVTGRSGQLYQDTSGDGRYLSLHDGWQYEIPLGADNWRKMNYARNDAALSNVQNDDSDEDPAHTLDTIALSRVTSADARAEFAWRITVPLMAVVLMMMSLPMSKQSPREPRYGRMMLAVAAFFLYFNLLALCRGQIIKGHWHNAGPLWLVSLLILGGAAWMFRSQYVARAPRKAKA
ncbi:LPS export ABC transporter permease LptF [Dyella sp. LX-66]|uniref:LPS export ABC transporter permease LptF n=1 Tax=unclassified Dyella TaxID=2634549 RepID=UPI001BE08EFA|nr:MULTISPECIES: LPS export ABC transporter permease LptF [unclassified Dyella]MBT2116207.1 LPS export ABC transporter permease LptF [Dyella sp. LX-1]MBT2138217.1 LPS export ABC transporter permease LptF [Dyella sp. LX-66]